MVPRPSNRGTTVLSPLDFLQALCHAVQNVVCGLWGLWIKVDLVEREVAQNGPRLVYSLEVISWEGAHIIQEQISGPSWALLLCSMVAKTKLLLSWPRAPSHLKEFPTHPGQNIAQI